MGKVKNPWLRRTSGKTAGLVFQGSSQAGGGTIVRELVTPKNPKSQAQTIQRAVFATVTQAAKYMFPLINHSFIDSKDGEVNRREFIRLNTKVMRQDLISDITNNRTFARANFLGTVQGVSALVPNAYIVSNGSQPLPVQYFYFSDSTDETRAGYFLTGPADESPLPYTVDLDAKTGSVKFIDVFNAIFFAEPGQQITFVGICNNPASSGYLYNAQPVTDSGFPIVIGNGYHIADTKLIARRLVLVDNPEALNKTYNALWSYQDDMTEISYNDDLLAELKADLLAAIDVEKTDPLVYSLYESQLIDNITFVVLGNDQAGIDTSFQINARDFIGTDNTNCAILAGGVIRSVKGAKHWEYSKTILSVNKMLAIAKRGGSNTDFGLIWNVMLEKFYPRTTASDSTAYLDQGGTIDTIGSSVYANNQ